MRLNEEDVSRIIKACKEYQTNTGSEYMWDEYEHLIHKLETLCEQGYCALSK
jgi:hypothetical protein|tara:strand:- start:339 stop:494 length:156 start_codon:yes stop_codon:yes gene_type:complete